MFHACPHCGSAPGGQAWATGPDGDTRAIADLTAQARDANPELARLLRIIRDQIRVQRNGLRQVETGLKRVLADVTRAIVDDLKAAPGADVPEKVRRMNLNASAIAEVLTGALDPVRGDLDDTMAELVVLAELQLEAGGITDAVDLSAIEAAARRLDREFWGDTIVQPTAQRMWDGLATTIKGDDLDTVAERIRRQSGGSIGRAMTEARTQLAEFDRTVTAVNAEAAGAEVFAYLGPKDAITRPFCRVLVDKVFTREQVGRLDNAQTVVSPIISGGGYNCRHSWSPLSEVAADAMGLERGTMGDVNTANRRARAAR